jgi:hypothetical protein
MKAYSTRRELEFERGVNPERIACPRSSESVTHYSSMSPPLIIIDWGLSLL